MKCVQKLKNNKINKNIIRCTTPQTQTRKKKLTQNDKIDNIYIL